jgi:hypothetical protein
VPPAEPLQIKDGMIEVPAKPGLGVDVDIDAIEAAHRLYLSKGLGARNNSIAMQYFSQVGNSITSGRPSTGNRRPNVPGFCTPTDGAGPQLMGGFAASRILEVHGERMINRTFDPGFRMELHQKDLNLALSSARQMGLSLPNTATAQELFNSCVAHGGKAWDHSALVRALEIMANFEIGAFVPQ